MVSQFQHREAFCLMKYATQDGLEVEWIWNSRDGVTPFCITNRDQTREMAHVDWHLDRRLPIYSPSEGQRIFVDMTPEIALPKINQAIEAYWNDGNYPMSATYATKDEARESLLSEYCKPGAPAIIVFHREAAKTTN